MPGKGNLKGDQFTWTHSVGGTAMRVVKASQSECEAAAYDDSMDQEAQRQMKTRARSYPSKAQFSDPHCKAYPTHVPQTLQTPKPFHKLRIRFSTPGASGRTLCAPII